MTSKIWFGFGLCILAGLTLLLFLGSDFMIQKTSPATKRVLSQQEIEATNAALSSSASSSSIRALPSPSLGKNNNNDNKNDKNMKKNKREKFAAVVVVSAADYRQPLKNGTFGEDPGRRIPCMMGGDHPQFFKQGDNRYMYKEFIKRREMLETHRDDGQYCFVGYQVTNAVFNLQYEPGWCCVYVPALHVPSKLFVGVDVHFHDYLIRGVVNTKEFPKWRQRLIADTEPIRQVWWQKYHQGKASAIGKPGTKYISDEIVNEARELALELIEGRKKPKKQEEDNAAPSAPSPQQQQQQPQQQQQETTTTTLPSPSTTTVSATTTAAATQKPLQAKNKEDLMMEVLYEGEHTTPAATTTSTTTTPSPVEESSLLSQVPPSAVKIVPANTEYVHILITDLVGMMPAVSVAQLMSYWGHFYSSGLQALGPEKITVVINKKSWGSVGAKLIDAFSRYFPVPALYVPLNTTFFAKKLTFAPRAYQDIVEPCAFHFLYHWMVPTVVERFQAAMRNGRKVPGSKDGEANVNGEIPPKGVADPVDYVWSSHGNVKEIAPGTFLRTPVPAEKERPWWPKEYDALVEHPPENLIIIKTLSGAYSGRMFEATPYFQKLASENGFKFVSDSAPHDVRMYLINHAKRLVTLWGGGGTVHSHLWGGGVKKLSAEENQKIRTLDVILLIHPGYDWEFGGFYEIPLRSSGIDVMKQRRSIQGNLSTFLCPPNEHDQWSEAAFAFGFAWTKMIQIDNINKLKKEHLFITDDEKKRDIGPHCKDRVLPNMIGPRWKSKWEFNP